MKPFAVPPRLRELSLPASNDAVPNVPDDTQRSRQHAAAAQALLQSYRLQGFRMATLDPLGIALRETSVLQQLDPRGFGLDRGDEPVALEFGGCLQMLPSPELAERARAA